MQSLQKRRAPSRFAFQAPVLAHELYELRLLPEMFFVVRLKLIRDKLRYERGTEAVLFGVRSGTLGRLGRASSDGDGPFKEVAYFASTLLHIIL